MKIGELASATATKVETVRYYEKIGLLAPPARTSANYRAYGKEHLARLS
jgi:DNA-binding transcriptional MerR regulator